MSITDGHELISPQAYGEHGVPHDLWTRLRAESPVHRCEPGMFEPFWAITKHADISEISRHPESFLSEPGITVLSGGQQDALESSAFNSMRVVIQMDPPEHRDVREFASDVAAAHPLRILSNMLGVPREQEPDILRLTNELFALDDPDLQREGADRQQAIMDLGMELYALFDSIIQDRRANPTSDLASVLANATIDGEPLGPMETIGYYLIIFSAGHDTTKNALVGGMRTFLEHPDEFRNLKDHPELVESAVEEVVRWTSPVNYMKRTAAVDTVVRGQEIARGDSVVLFYASANRDEDVFDDPFGFRIDRDPNRHLGFGIGEHFCLGAHMARRSQRALWLELSRRLDWVELAGEPERIHSSFVVGLKHLPIRYRIRPAADR
jgi:hypothetical protein